MNQRQFELYRLHITEQMPNSPYRAAVRCGICHKLMRLELLGVDGAARAQTSGFEGELDDEDPLAV